MPRWEEQSPRWLAPDRAASMQPEETEAGAWWAWGLWSQEPRPRKANTGWRRRGGGGFRRQTCWWGVGGSLNREADCDLLWTEAGAGACRCPRETSPGSNRYGPTETWPWCGRFRAADGQEGKARGQSTIRDRRLRRGSVKSGGGKGAPTTLWGQTLPRELSDTRLLGPLVSEEAVASRLQPLSPTPGAPPSVPGCAPSAAGLHMPVSPPGLHTAICVGLCWPRPTHLSALPTAQVSHGLEFLCFY